MGICSVGYKGSFLKQYEPVIICPYRFLEGIVFQTIRERFFPDWKYVRWVKEVNMGVSGNIDYVAMKTDESGSSADDFFCVEFQANGTTGSPYPYVRDLLENGFYNKKYTFGLNWANEFMKTMMQQVYKKGQVISSWSKKIVFVIQDVALKYLEKAVDTSGLKENTNDPIHFITYRLEWNDENGKYCLVEDRWISTDLAGVNKILAGATSDRYLTVAYFLNNALRKGREDGILNV